MTRKRRKCSMLPQKSLFWSVFTFLEWRQPSNSLSCRIFGRKPGAAFPGYALNPSFTYRIDAVGFPSGADEGGNESKAHEKHDGGGRGAVYQEAQPYAAER